MKTKACRPVFLIPITSRRRHRTKSARKLMHHLILLFGVFERLVWQYAMW